MRLAHLGNLWALLLCLAGASLPGAAAAQALPRVVFLLDCSRSMEAKLPAGGAVHEVSTATGYSRMDAAKDVLKATLTRLSASGNTQAGVWLYGHRLAWGEGKEPELMEQTDYLEQTLGFNVLRNLLPGDDIELARPVTRLDAEALPPLFVRLDAVKPWGEAPLYLALHRALDNLGRESTGMNTTFVVITAGYNKQGYCRFMTNKAELQQLAQERGIPIHFVLLPNADEPNRQGEAELEQIAEATRGTLTRATSSDELLARLDDSLKARPAASTSIAATPAPATVPGEAVQTVSTTPALPKTRNVEGQVVSFDRPVRGAKVWIEGSGAPATTTDAAGRFSFAEVPVGSYRLVYEATVKNIIRNGAKPLRIEPKADAPLALRLVLQ